MKLMILLSVLMLGCSASVQWRFGNEHHQSKIDKPTEKCFAPKYPDGSCLYNKKDNTERNPHRLFDTEE